MRYLFVLLFFVIFTTPQTAQQEVAGINEELIINNPSTSPLVLIIYHNDAGSWEKVDRIHIPAGFTAFFPVGWGFCSDYGYKKVNRNQEFVLPFYTCEVTIF